MFGILKWECIVHGKELENVKQDRKHSKRIERYEVSENAIYFDGKYLPVSLIKSMRSQPRRFHHRCIEQKKILVFLMLKNPCLPLKSISVGRD